MAENKFSRMSFYKVVFFCRFEETNEGGSTCKTDEKCIGGYARAITVIKELKNIRANPIYLNAGDNFQGTLWYSMGGWNVTSQFLNILNADAIVSFKLGKHEMKFIYFTETIPF